jgi:CheY-like chemotaxis protein
MAELPRVLVVEDDPSTVELMQRLLMRQGYEVPAAASYGDALHMATEWLPDVLISDLALPGKTGFRCSRRCAKRTRA